MLDSLSFLPENTEMPMQMAVNNTGESAATSETTYPTGSCKC